MQPQRRSQAPVSHYIYDFAEGSRHQADLLGGKGANLAEMTRLGLPVPPGFTITTEACRAYLAHRPLPAGLAEEIDRRTCAGSSRRWAAGSATRPTRCCSRCARAPGSRCPGMMETDPRHRPERRQRRRRWPRTAATSASPGTPTGG